MSRKPIKPSGESKPAAGDRPTLLKLVGAVMRGRGGRPGPPLSLDIDEGAAHVITAGPGTGKTAILESIALARSPHRGIIQLFGRDIAKMRPKARYALRRRMGVIFQELRLVDDLSVRDNVALAARAAGRRPEDYEAPLGELLAWVGLGKRASEPASRLDAEGRGRLAVARAVINSPDLLIADEPRGEGMLKLLSDLHHAGTAMLIATGDAELAAQSGAEITTLVPVSGFPTP